MDAKRRKKGWSDFLHRIEDVDYVEGLGDFSGDFVVLDNLRVLRFLKALETVAALESRLAVSGRYAAYACYFAEVLEGLANFSRDFVILDELKVLKSLKVLPVRCPGPQITPPFEQPPPECPRDGLV
jgi:hypothetical protein